MSCRGLLLIALLAAPAWAMPPVSMSLGYSAQVFSARSFDLVSSQDHLQQFRVGAGYALAAWKGFVDLEVAYASGGTNAISHGSVPTYFVMQGIEAAVAFRLAMFKHFEPYVQLGGGYDWVTLTVFGESRLTQTVNNLAGKGMLGAQIPFKLGPSYSKAPFLLMDLGVGYVVRPGAGFHSMSPMTSGTPPDEPIAHAGTDLGTLPMSGISYRVLVTCRL